MKQEEFEHTLKQLSGDFTLPVSNSMFDAMMEKRNRQRRRKKFLAWIGGCSVAAALMLVTVFSFDSQEYVNTAANNKDAVQEQQNVSSAKSNMRPHRARANTTAGLQHDNQHPKPVRVQGSQSMPQAAATSPDQEYGRGMKHSGVIPAVKEPIGKAPATPMENSGKGSVAQNSNPTGKQTFALTGGVKKDSKPVAGRNTADGNILSNKEQAETTVADNHNNTATNNSAQSEEDNAKTTEHINPEEKVQAKDETIARPAMAAAETTQASNNADSSVKQEPQKIKRHRWMAGFYGDYTPVTSVRNSNAAIPLPHTDSLGLSDKPKYAYSAGFNFGYAISDRWKINVGLGYHQVQFDEVRFSSNIKIDSIQFESLTSGNSSSLKSNDGYYYAYNISDRSLGWMQVPVSVGYITSPQKRVSFYTQAGIVYQLLVKSKGYEFTSWNDSLRYEEISNKGSNRINKNQFAFFIEPGVKIQLTPRIFYQAGITYRRHLTTLYKKEYHSNSPAYYLGVSSALNFIF